MKNLKKVVAHFLLAALVVLGISDARVMAMSDGAYTVSISYSYKNPETNQTADGSSNVALGESMIASMLEKQALVEQVNGKTYVTIGLGLMSNVSNVTIKTQSTKGGSYKTASITKTGSSKANGDTCNHYRFQVSNTATYISPVLFIDPMGRDVQFFIKLNMGSAKKGTGIYNSEMVKTATEAPKKTETPKATTAPVKATEKPQKTTKPATTKAPVSTSEATAATEQTKAPAQTAEATMEVTETSMPSTAPETTQDATVQESEAPQETQAAEKEEEQPQQAEEVTATETPAVQTVVTEGSNHDALLIAIICVCLAGMGALFIYNKRGRKHE